VTSYQRRYVTEMLGFDDCIIVVVGW